LDERLTMGKLIVFVSSVQKELENERIAVSEVVSSDPFLNREVRTILFEYLPASAKPAQSAYLDALEESEIYIGILGFEYGRKGPDDLSATQREYRAARKQGLPTYFFVKGDNSQDSRRDSDIRDFFKEIRDEQSGHVYKRFTHYRSLQQEVRAVLLAELRKRGIHPTDEENAVAEQTIAQASDFDSRLVQRATVEDLDVDLCRQFVANLGGKAVGEIDEDSIHKALSNRGLIWVDDEANTWRPTNGSLILLGDQPEAFFPQNRIATNAYPGKERGDPIDRDDIRIALPRAVERVFAFLLRNMRHTTRIEGFSKVQVDEYCYSALREAVVNAVAHRDYDAQGSCIRIDKYEDRIEILSPGLPPDPLTLPKIQALDYIACSRNPNLARGLSAFERIEEQGDGLRRIVRETVDLGLPKPVFDYRDGHFLVVFPAPKDIRKIRSQHREPIFSVDASDIDQLSETQSKIVRILLEHSESRVPDIAETLARAEPTIRKALKELREKGWVSQHGKARETIYRLKERNRP